MSSELLAERVAIITPRYEEMFANRGGVTPTDPLKFHLFHLARYWSRLVGFCRQGASPDHFINSDLGACIQVGSEFADALIVPDSPIYQLWQDYWTLTQAVLHRPPVWLAAVEAASLAFDACTAGLRYDPWSNKSAARP